MPTPSCATGAHKAGDDEWGCISRCVECEKSLVSAALPEGAKVFVIVQASGRIIVRYHCSLKADGKHTCGDAGTCNLPVDTLEGARAHKIECDKLVAKLESGAPEVDVLLHVGDKAKMVSKYRKASVKHTATVARFGSARGGGGGAGSAAEEGV